MRNTFFFLCSQYHLLSKAFERERDAVKEPQQIKAFPSPSLTAVLMQEMTDLGDELMAEKTMQGKRLE